MSRLKAIQMGTGLLLTDVWGGECFL